MYDVEIQFSAGYSVTAFHAATHVLAGGELADPRWTEALEGGINSLGTVASSYANSVESFCRHVAPLAGQIENNTQLGEVLFRKCSAILESTVRDAAFARAAAELENALKGLEPDLLDKMDSRAKPLRAEWKEWGPRLLSGFAGQTDPRMLVPRAEVFVTPIIAGNAGRAFLPYNSLVIETADEATDATPKFVDFLTERVLAMAWNIAQLNVDLPMYAENLLRGGHERVGALATIPAILAAAQKLELGHCTAEAVAGRIQRWRPEYHSGDTATTVWNWWQTYVNSETTWPVAMIALDRMLFPACTKPDAAAV